MLWTVAVMLFVLWVLGMVSSYAMGGFVHLLLVLAFVMTVIDLLRERRPLTERAVGGGSGTKEGMKV